MAPFSSLLFLSTFLLISIDKIIFTFFLKFWFSFLFYCLLHFPSGYNVWFYFCFVFYFYFANFFISFFLQILHFVVSIQFSSFISFASFKFIISCFSFPWVSTHFFSFFYFFFFFLTLLFLFKSQLLHCDFPQYSLIFSSFSLVAAFHSSSLFSSISDSAFYFLFFSFLLHLFSSHSSSFLLFQFQPSFPHSSALLDYNNYNSRTEMDKLLLIIKCIITMLFLFLCKFLNFYLLLFSFLLFFISSSSLLPPSSLFLLPPSSLFLLPPSSLFLHIPVWRFPQFSLSFPGSGAPRSRTLSIPAFMCLLL